MNFEDALRFGGQGAKGNCNKHGEHMYWVYIHPQTDMDTQKGPMKTTVPIKKGYMDGCRNYGPFLDPCYDTAPLGYPQRGHNSDNCPEGFPC